MKRCYKNVTIILHFTINQSYGHAISAELIGRIMATADQWQSCGFGTGEIDIFSGKRVSYEQKGCQGVLHTLTYSLQPCYLPPPTYPQHFSMVLLKSHDRSHP